MRLAVEAKKALALAAEPGTDGPVELVGVIDVQRPSPVETDVVGHVDQRIDRPQANRAEPLLHPGRRLADADTPEVTARETGTGVGRCGGKLELDLDRAAKRAFDARQLWLGFERAQAGRRQVAGDAAHPGAVRPVRGELDLDDGIGKSHGIGKGLANPLAHFGRQLNNAAAFLRELQLGLGDQHASRNDAAHGTRFQRQGLAGNVAANRREHPDHSRARVRRPTDDLDNPGAGLDFADLELVGIGVRFGLEHAGDAKGLERRAAVLDAFDLQPQCGQLGGQLGERRGGVEMILEPGECELHHCYPRASRRRRRRASARRARRNRNALTSAGPRQTSPAGREWHISAW